MGSQFVDKILETVTARNPSEPEFIQAVREVLESIEPVVQKRPELARLKIVERIVEPERQILFRVPWIDDKGDTVIDYRPVHLNTLSSDVAYIPPKERKY